MGLEWRCYEYRLYHEYTHVGTKDGGPVGRKSRQSGQYWMPLHHFLFRRCLAVHDARSVNQIMVGIGWGW